MRSGCTEAARKQSVANSFPAAAKQKGLNVDPCLVVNQHSPTAADTITGFARARSAESRSPETLRLLIAPALALRLLNPCLAPDT